MMMTDCTCRHHDYQHDTDGSCYVCPCQQYRPTAITTIELRDLFAAFALTLGEGIWPGGHLAKNVKQLAANCYLVADAMLEARKDNYD